ncbi:MAG: hypothetical protein AAB906_00715 [Patescibacteria group bacterium]
MDDVTQKTEEILAENIRLQVAKLAALLRDSNMPEDVKNAWVAILPKMTPAQIDRFVNILEAKYLDEQTRAVDDEFGKEIKSLIDGFEK